MFSQQNRKYGKGSLMMTWEGNLGESNWPPGQKAN